MTLNAIVLSVLLPDDILPKLADVANKFGMFQPGRAQTDYPEAQTIQKAQIGTNLYNLLNSKFI